MKSFQYSVEEFNPPEWRYGRDAVTCMRYFKIPWANHRDFIEKVLGTAVGTINTIYPDKLTSMANMEAVEASVKDFMQGNPKEMSATANSTDEATIVGDCEVTVTYSTEDRTANTEEGENVGDGAYLNPHNPGGPPILLEYEADETAEVAMIPGRHMRDVENKPAKADEYFGIPILNTNHRITIMGVNDLPPARSSLRGKINAASFEIPVVGITIPKECGLFRGSTLQRRYTARDFNSGNEPAWNITYQIVERIFKEGEMTWNHFISGGKVKKMHLADGNDVYKTGNFSALFFFP